MKNRQDADEEAELRQAGIEMGLSPAMIERLLAESYAHPFGDDARDYEDEYPRTP